MLHPEVPDAHYGKFAKPQIVKPVKQEMDRIKSSLLILLLNLNLNSGHLNESATEVLTASTDVQVNNIYSTRFLIDKFFKVIDPKTGFKVDKSQRSCPSRTESYMN